MKTFVATLVLFATVLSCNSQQQLTSFPLLECSKELVEIAQVENLGKDFKPQCIQFVRFENCLLNEVKNLVTGGLHGGLLGGLIGGLIDGLLTTLFDHVLLIRLGLCEVVPGVVDKLIKTLFPTGNPVAIIIKQLENAVPAICAVKAVKKCLLRRITNSALSMGRLCTDTTQYFQCVNVELQSCNAPIASIVIRGLNALAPALACLIRTLLEAVTNLVPSVLGLLG